MKKLLLGIGVVMLIALAAPLFAQGPFADVPTDHWAYSAVNDLQEDGLVIGYPDGTFGGKRTMTRYEFAVAIARMIPLIQQGVADTIRGEQGIPGPKGDKGDMGPAGPKGESGSSVSDAQIKSLQSLMTEFRDELATLGVDVESLRRDLNALTARVEALEKGGKVDWQVMLNTFAIATQHDDGVPVDRDGRPLQLPAAKAGKFINSISFVKDLDLWLTGNLSPEVKVVADINVGNYLNYLEGVVDTPATGVRPAAGTPDEFFPYYAYIETAMGNGSLTVGRFPVQLTPYTLKMIDIDSYTENCKTDSGNYPLDGGKLTWKFGGVGLTTFAAKLNQNAVLSTGLVYDQTAAARVTVGTPLEGQLGLNYVNLTGPAIDELAVMGADWGGKFGTFGFAAEYEISNLTPTVGPEVDEDNTALDAKITVPVGGLGLDLGYRIIEANFNAPGNWFKIGNTFNPTNVTGPYAYITYGITPSVSLVANGAWYKGADDLAGTLSLKDDKVWKAEADLKWGFTPNTSLMLGTEYVNWQPDGADNDAKETYITIGLLQQLTANTAVDLSYQIINWNGDAGAAVADYKGAVAVAQFKAKF